MIQFLFFLHFILIFLIISCVLLQRSSESSVLVSSNHFSVGTANKLLVKITQILVSIFILNCLVISYVKYHSIEKAQSPVHEQTNVAIPENSKLPDIDAKQVPLN